MEMWSCKGYTETVTSKSELLRHYKLKPPHFGCSSHFPCTYQHCPCTFKTWNAKVHFTEATSKECAILSCHLCACSHFVLERYYLGIILSLKKWGCMFLGCDFKTIIYCTFNSIMPSLTCWFVVNTISSVNKLEADSQECIDRYSHSLK